LYQLVCVIFRIYTSPTPNITSIFTVTILQNYHHSVITKTHKNDTKSQPNPSEK